MELKVNKEKILNIIKENGIEGK